MSYERNADGTIREVTDPSELARKILGVEKEVPKDMILPKTNDIMAFQRAERNRRKFQNQNVVRFAK